MNIMPGPDFPTGGVIMGRKGIFDAFSKGQGSIKIRGKIEHESTLEWKWFSCGFNKDAAKHLLLLYPSYLSHFCT